MIDSVSNNMTMKSCQLLNTIKMKHLISKKLIAAVNWDPKKQSHWQEQYMAIITRDSLMTR